MLSEKGAVNVEVYAMTVTQAGQYYKYQTELFTFKFCYPYRTLLTKQCQHSELRNKSHKSQPICTISTIHLAREGLIDWGEARKRVLKLFFFITHRLIFVRFYWLLYVTRCTITGRVSRNDPHLRRYLSSDYFR